MFVLKLTPQAALRVMGTVLGAFSLACTLSACAPAIVAGAAGATYLAVQEGGPGLALSDLGLKARIKDALASKDFNTLGAIGVDVLNHDVVLTGMVDSPQTRDDIAQIVRAVQGVGGVYNELQVGAYSPSKYAQDSWLAAQLRTQLLAAATVFNVNYSITVVQGEVYIVGIARSELEFERVMHMARTTKGVKAVHNFVRFKKEIEGQGDDAAQASSTAGPTSSVSPSPTVEEERI